jgi:salicylate biosynthesis isochorismate synthase/menaquinone-specific isochorismate synthase
MTVVDRQAAAPSGARIRVSLAATLRRASRQSAARPLIWVTTPTIALDPIDLFAAARSLDLEAALWFQPSTGQSFVGIGRAWAIEPEGPNRFATAATAWRAVLANAVGSDNVAAGGPILLGGLGFSGRRPSLEDPWGPFGPASLVLPTFTVVRRPGDAAELTVTIAPDRTEDPDPAEVEGAWREIERAALEAPAGAGAAPSALRVVEERPDRAAWERTVGQFAGAVGRGRIDKVVLARRVVLEGAGGIDVADVLRRLARSGAESTVVAFARGRTTFVGATPERLVRTAGRSFETVAIAGSMARGRDEAEDEALARTLLTSEKEREEHAVVVDGLRADLAPIVETLDVASAPTVLRLRHVQHLATPITGTTRDQTGLLLLAGRLHPTPAVGGAPREMALAMIEEHEAFDRGWYAGPIGWLGADGDGELLVALRCGLIADRTATLFAGCGIVADSDPAHEWEESRLKLRTMLEALGAAQVPTEIGR